MSYQITPQPFDPKRLDTLLRRFEINVRREIDVRLARELRHDLLETAPARLTRAPLLRLARWCDTEGGVYEDAMTVAREISVLLFGKVISRRELNT